MNLCVKVGLMFVLERKYEPNKRFINYYYHLVTMKAKCKICGYEWDSDSKLDYITCPNCMRKFKVKEIKQSNLKEMIKGDEDGKDKI